MPQQNQDMFMNFGGALLPIRAEVAKCPDPPAAKYSQTSKDAVLQENGARVSGL